MNNNNRIATAVVLLAGVFASPWSVAHDDPPPVVTITATPSSTTLSRTSTTNYASYTVKVTNASDDKLNYLVFTATSVVVNTDPVAPIAPFLASDGLASPCTPINSDATAISCTLPPLAKYVGTVTFTLVFKAPTSGTSINLNSKLTFAEDAYHYRRTVLASASTGLDAPVADRVTSYVPSGTGGTFPTGLTIGADGVASATTADPWVTTVVVPSGKATTVAIQESTVLTSCALFTSCFLSDITIPGSNFNHLTIYLTRDVSTIPRSKRDDDCDNDDARTSKNRGVTIDNAVIRYEHVLGAGFVDVPNCSVNPSLPLPGQPCVKNRVAFPKKAPTPSVDQGDWRFEIWAADNGRYTN